METSVKLFGCMLDPDDDETRVAIRAAYARRSPTVPTDAPRDPYAVLQPYLQNILPELELAGTLPVPTWLQPFPAAADLPQLTPKAFRRFVADDGCQESARQVETFVETHVWPAVPAMIGVDHSLSGGAIRALSRRHGPDNLAVVVVDAHYDAIPQPLRDGLLAFARQHRRRPYRIDPARYQPAHLRASTYHCGSFLRLLVDEGTIRPEQLAVVGVADYPNGALQRERDPRVAAFVESYHRLERTGATLVRQDEIQQASDPGEYVASRLSKLAGKDLYISVDLDAAAVVTLSGARFLDPAGLAPEPFFGAVEGALAVAGRGRLVGFDVMELDFYRAGAVANGAKDRTYDIVLDILARLTRVAIATHSANLT